MTAKFVSTTALLTSTIAAIAYVEAPRAERLREPLATVNPNLAGWVSAGDDTLSDRTLRVLGPTEYLVRSYESDGRTAGLFIAFYAQQRTGESVHSPEACLPGEGWSIERRRTVEIPLGGEGESAPVKLYSIRTATNRAAVLYWYQSRRRIVAGEYRAKLFLMRDALFDRVSGGAIVRLTVADDEAAIKAGMALAAAVIPEVARCL